MGSAAFSAASCACLIGAFIAPSSSGQSPRAGNMPPPLGSAKLPWIRGTPAAWALRAQPWICNRKCRVVDDMSLAGLSATNHLKTWSAIPSSPYQRRRSPKNLRHGHDHHVWGIIISIVLEWGVIDGFGVVLRPLFAPLMTTLRFPCAASVGQFQETWLGDFGSSVGSGRLGIVVEEVPK